MRYREIILEGPNAYLPMFNGIPVNKGALVTHLREVEEALKRQDRIQWFLRFSRIWHMNKAERNGQPIDEKTRRKALVAINPTITWGDAVTQADEAMGDFTTFKHFVAMTQVKAIQDVVWDKQSPYALVHHLDDLEEKWKEKVRKTSVRAQNGDEILIDFKNGWAWWLLARGYCQDEANAMGHCGNAGAASNERILSLRQKLTDEHWEPHLTFIIDHEGELGEMKGKNNDKPIGAYHKYILALLRNPIVKGIKGGGYLPENNFALKDLPSDERQKLVNEKPALKEVSEVYTDWNRAPDQASKNALLPTLKYRVERDLGNHGYDYDTIDWNKMEIIVHRTSLDDYVREKRNEHLAAVVYDLIDDDLEFYLEDMDDAPANFKQIAEAVQADYLQSLFKQTLNIGVHFKFQGMGLSYDEESKTILYEISVGAYCYEEDENIEGASSLMDEDDTDSYRVSEDLADLDLDDIEKAMIAYARDKYNEKKKKAMLVKIVKHYEGLKAAPALAEIDPNQPDFFR